MVGTLKPVHLAMNSHPFTKRTRVVSTILGITSTAAVMLVVLGRISSHSSPGMVRSGVTAHSMQTPNISRTSRSHRVLAYGDSLTAGTSGMQLYPYAPALEKAIAERSKNDDDDSVVVRHRGLPGWTTQDMLNDLDGPRTGLRSAIQGIQDPPLSLVILLAGTNDLGHGLDSQRIADNLVQLHTICLELGVPRTIAVGIPPSGYQSQHPTVAELASAVNKKLEVFASQSKGNTTFVPFPFEYVKDGENWFRDSLHFSEAGYKSLGESLAPLVKQQLESINLEKKTLDFK